MTKNIGYELRCADPIPFDMEYTAATSATAPRATSARGARRPSVSIQHGRFKPLPFKDIMDPHTGRMRVRMVDVESDRYKIARTYMLRLKQEDFRGRDGAADVGRDGASHGEAVPRAVPVARGQRAEAGLDERVSGGKADLALFSRNLGGGPPKRRGKEIPP